MSWVSTINLRVVSSSEAGLAIKRVEVKNQESADSSLLMFPVGRVVVPGEKPSFSARTLCTYKLTAYLAGTAGTPAFQGRVLIAVTDDSNEALPQDEVALDFKAQGTEEVLTELPPGATLEASFTSTVYNPKTLRLRTTKGSRTLALDRVELLSQSSGERTYFHFGETLPAPATFTATPLAMADYEVTFVTSDIRGNGHDAGVTIQVIGKLVSGDKQLAMTDACITCH
ncbi:hypothetical protein QJQ45_021975 [Haematococcus lacustris]|nr:hypothetical protein QJQ45_021975 [Haematococcus lacustris]